MKKLAFGLCAAVMLLAVSQRARAAVVIYDFSSLGYSDGQNLEGLALGPATFTSETGDLRYYAGYGGGIGTGYAWGAAADTYISFASPVSNLWFRGGDGGGDADAFEVSLYAFGTDAFLGTFATPKFDDDIGPTYYTLNLTVADVGRLVFDPGNSGVLPGVKEGQGGLVITDMGFETGASPVPDGASTLALLGLCLAGIAILRRRF